MITTVMLDMDGTLIPFQQEEFIKVYFGELCKKLAPLGYEPEHTVKSVWAGTRAMAKNDGSCLNSECFWEVFHSMNEGMPDAKPLCDEFYTNEFKKAKAVVKYDVDRKPLIDKLRSAGLNIVLATNPMFPADGMYTRLSWVGLSPEDFDYISHYDNSTYCKPSPKYFTEICEKLGIKPEECVMIGNSVQDDMAAARAGLKVFLVPEWLENPAEEDHSALPQGTLDEAAEYVLSLM